MLYFSKDIFLKISIELFSFSKLMDIISVKHISYQIDINYFSFQMCDLLFKIIVYLNDILQDRKAQLLLLLLLCQKI